MVAILSVHKDVKDNLKLVHRKRNECLCLVPTCIRMAVLARSVFVHECMCTRLTYICTVWAHVYLCPAKK